MKIKLDHNLSPLLAAILDDLGHDVKTAAEERLEKASDSLLLYEATVEERILFTLDKGFADVDRYPPDTHAGIVVFDQRKTESIAQVEQRLVAFARSRSKRKLEGHVVVVERTRIRFPRGRRKGKRADGPFRL